MFGLTIEKLFLVAIVAGVVIGPRRLPEYAQKLAEFVRTARAALDGARSAAERDIGISRDEWDSLDPRRYHPRRIVREAMNGPTASREVTSEPGPDPAQAARVRPGQKYLVTGSAAHPRRVLIEDLPEDDPRRIAATVEDLTTSVRP